MLRLASRLSHSMRPAATKTPFSVLATSSPLSAHGRACRCGNCSRHAMGCSCSACVRQSRGFAVTSQAQYDIPKTQTAIVFEEFGVPFNVRNDWPVVQADQLQPGQVLVRMAYTGVCHTDLHIWHGEGPPFVSLPVIGGHEGAGYVAAIGANTNTKLKVGDPVGVKWLANSCLGCEDCRKGHEPTCEEAEIHGAMIGGSFQQWCVSYADHVTPIPKELPLDSAAPILCAGVTVYKALKEFGGNTGDTVVIPGAGGGLGHLACQYARAMGYRVIAIDSGEEKRKLVASYGIRDFIDFKDGDVVERVKAITPGGRGVHGAIVVASSGEAYNQALEFLRPFGSLIMVGVPNAPIVADMPRTVAMSHRIIGSYVGNRQDAVEALQIAAFGDVKVKYELSTLANLAGAFDRMANGSVSGRIVLDCE